MRSSRKTLSADDNLKGKKSQINSPIQKFTTCYCHTAMIALTMTEKFFIFHFLDEKLLDAVYWC